MVKLTETSTKLELSPTLAANEKVLELRAQGKEILHMGFGESPFPVPKRLKQSLYDAAHRKDYLPTGGLPDLCTAAKDYYQEKINLAADEYDVLIAPGSKLILYALQMAIEGDLLLPVPSWVSYGPQAHMLKTQPVLFPAELNKEGMRIDPDNLRKTIATSRNNGQNPTKLILNSPSNPTGLIYNADNLREIAEICEEEDIFIISDEIYGFVSFDEKYNTISKYAASRTAISTGLSKHLSLGGWRIGIGFIPKSTPGLYTLLCQIASETWSCVPAPIQQASIDAYKGHSDIEEHIKACTQIHKFMNHYISKSLYELGLFPRTAQGAFYTYPDFEKYREKLKAYGVTTSNDLADFLLAEYALVSLPGTAFGEIPEKLTLRLSGCDYDGASALKAYENGEELGNKFIKTYAPHIICQVQAFQDLTDKLAKI